MAEVRYVSGFLFTEGRRSRARVLLIQKLRPKWQCGLLNGVGGKVNGPELPMVAMMREFEEEAGLRAELCWYHSATLTRGEATVFFYAAWTRNTLFDAAQAKTDEPLFRVHMKDLWKQPLLPELQFLIPMAYDRTGISKPIMLNHTIPVDVK